MNKKRQVFALLLVLLLILPVLLTACGKKELMYSVTVTDALGTPYTKGVAVKFIQKQEQAGIQAVNKEGVAEMLLPAGDYAVALQFANETYTCNQSDLMLSASQTQLTVIVNRTLSGEGEPLSVGDEEYTAYVVDEGCTELSLDAEKMCYFLFAPERTGVYQISLVDTDATIGHYGYPYFVLQQSIAAVTDNTFSVLLKEEDVGENAFPLVLGVSAGAGKAVLCISRTGDVVEAAEEQPWSTEWQKLHEKTDGCRVELTKTPKYFDITAKSGKYKLFYDEETGYYRQKKNGPVVLVALGKITNPKIQCAGLYERINGNGMYGGSDVVRYFYDASGTLEKQEKYTDALLEIFDHCDITAYDQEVYHPLTQDLMYILQNGFADWWNPESPDFQQSFEGANPEYAWLFACCYVK